MTIAVVDSGGANIASVLHALRRLGAEPVFTSDARAVQSADRVLLPGVGAAARAMAKLRQHDLVSTLRALQQPVFGICLGMQLLFQSTDEGESELLGMIPAHVERLDHKDGLRVPHMGWNSIRTVSNYKLCDGMSGMWFYFVHSYAAPTGDWTLATTEHGRSFSAIVRSGNYFGAQFHPERSAAPGAALLKRFLDLDP